MKINTFINSFILFFSLILLVPTVTQAGTQKDISYSHDAHPRKKLDIYTPNTRVNDKKLPVLIHIHGGGWKIGDKKIQRKHGNFYSSHDIIFVNINYRLSPEVKHPAHIEDSAEAVSWVFQHLDELGGDKNRIFISGHSAGAHLAALLGTNPSYLNKHNIQITQLAGIIPVDTASFDLLSPDNERFSKRLIKNAFGNNKESLISASPLRHINNGQKYPDFLIFASGKRDASIQQGKELSRQLNETGNTAKIIVVEGYNHRDMNLGMREPNGPVSNAILNIIN